MFDGGEIGGERSARIEICRPYTDSILGTDSERGLLGGTSGLNPSCSSPPFALRAGKLGSSLSKELHVG